MALDQCPECGAALDGDRCPTDPEECAIKTARQIDEMVITKTVTLAHHDARPA